MRTQHAMFRFTAAAAIGGLMMGPGLAPLAKAQTATTAPVDPPARVGRVAALLGTVSFHTADETEWQKATLNYPVTSGNAFWTEPSAGAEIEVDAAHVAMDQGTEYEIATLDDHNFAATEPQGAVYLRLRNVLPGDATSITTPRGTVSVTAAGRYEIVAGDAEQPTRLTVLEGAADIAVGNLTLHVAPHQTASVTGSDADSFQGSVGVEVNDPFLTAQLAKERPAPARRVAVGTIAYQPPPVVANMTGYDSIRDTGDWVQTPQYGHVWYPPVTRDWVPYRHGHWAFVNPWGWTWVDDAAWGFAPFHYGRWVQVQSRWGWIPTEPGVVVQPDYVRPVYAPALVSFVHVSDAAVGLAVGVAAGLALGASVGWIPLGPREMYVPPFRASPDYIRNVNVTQVRNVTNIGTINNVTTNTTTINNFVNRGGATVVPAMAMTASLPVAQAVQRVTPQQLTAARFVPQAPVPPTLATAGVTPVVARQMNIAPAPNAPQAPPRPAAPGPVVAARAAPVPAASPTPPAGAAPGAAPAIPAAAPANPAAAAKPPAIQPGLPAATTAGVAAAATPARALHALPPVRPAAPVSAKPTALLPASQSHPAAPTATTPAPSPAVQAMPAKPVTPTPAPAPAAAAPAATAVPPAAKPASPAPAPTPAPGPAIQATPGKPVPPVAKAANPAPAPASAPGPAIQAAPVKPVTPAPAAPPAAATHAAPTAAVPSAVKPATPTPTPTPGPAIQTAPVKPATPATTAVPPSVKAATPAPAPKPAPGPAIQAAPAKPVAPAPAPPAMKQPAAPSGAILAKPVAPTLAPVAQPHRAPGPPNKVCPGGAPTC